MANGVENSDNQERLKRALIALQKMQAKLEAAEKKQCEPIAIIGMGCRYPGGAETPEKLWELLAEQVDAISEVPADHWPIDDYYDANPNALGKIYTRYGGFINDIYDFDAAFFSISPREALNLDPQQRLLLEVAWEALEYAAIAPDSLKHSQTGVFVGISSTEYGQLLMNRPPEAIDSYVGSGNAHSVAAGRLSYFLDLQAPAVAIDTACSSSLVALHLACQSLRLGECDMAINGGVNLLISPSVSLNHSRAKMLARDGRCKAFDASADGFIRSDGCGVLILKRLSDAEAAGDNILAVIKGSAVNQDGHTSGLTVPSGPSQQAVISRALRNAGLKPGQISYIEAHGTGTALGDPIEVGALTAVFGQDRDHDKPLRVGSIKTNIGHAEAAAGVAGVMKVVLALQNQQIPAHLHYRTPNPLIDWAAFPGEIPLTPTAWTDQETSRYAGVSSFGFGGTNAHVVLAQAPKQVARDSQNKPCHILALSAKSDTAWQDITERYRQYLIANPDVDLGDLCYSANTGRAHFKSRLAVVAESSADLRAKLEAADFASNGDRNHPRTVFLFTGQGSQYPGMGQLLYQTEPVFQKALERCHGILQTVSDIDLLALLYAENADSAKINQTANAQPAIFALEYALSELWQSWGIEPDAVIGHSVGEYAAAVVAGVFSLEDGLKLIAERGRLMQALPETGGMLAVAAGEQRVAVLLEPYRHDVAIAAINGADKVVLSGRSQALIDINAQLEQDGIGTTWLTVSHGFHSPLMEPMLAEFEQFAGQIRFAPPEINFVSNLTGTWAIDDLADTGYWVRHVRQPVQFAAGMATLLRDGYELFLEIGAKPILLGMAELPPDVLSVPSLRQGQPDPVQMLNSLAVLYQSGCKIAWTELYQARYYRKLVLPRYPFQRQNYRIKAAMSASQNAKLSPGAWYESVWLPEEAMPTAGHGLKRHWLIFADTGGLAEQLTEQLNKQGDSWHLVHAADRYQVLDPHSSTIDPASKNDYRLLLETVGTFDNVLHLWSLEAATGDNVSITDLQAATDRGARSVLYLSQALADLPKPSSLWLVTRNTQAVTINDKVTGLAQAPLWGLGKTIAVEYQDLWGGMVDLGDTGPDEASSLLNAISKQGDEDWLALRNGQRFVARLKSLDKPAAGIAAIAADGSYLITGGLGGLGLVLADWLVKKGAKHLVLTGRRGVADEQALQKLEQAGASLLALSADVADAADMQRVFASITEQCPPLRGIIHAAGLPGYCPLPELTGEDLNAQFAAKVYGTWLLAQYSRGSALDFFVCCSSIVSAWGAKGQGHYVAANQFLDSFAHYYRQQGGRALTINWGPMTGGGMLQADSIGALHKIGVSTLPLAGAGDHLEKLLAGGTTHAVVADIDWSLYRSIYEIKKPKPLFKLIQTQTDALTLGVPKSSPAILSLLQQAPPSERKSLLAGYIAKVLAKVLGIASAASIAPKQGFFDLGIDSLTAMELKNRLQADIQLSLPASLAFDYATVETLTNYLLGRLNDIAVADVREESDAQQGSDAAQEAETVAHLQQLSEQEAEALLISKLQGLEGDDDDD